MADDGIEQRISGQGARTHRFVVLAIEDETVQAMICVALEQGGYQPLAAAGLAEAVALIASLPRCPIALIVSPADAEDHPLRHLSGLLNGKDGPIPPTLLVERPAQVPGEPDLLAPPDLAAILRTVGALALA